MAAAVLGYVQAGITLVPTILFLIGLTQAKADDAALGWIVMLAQAVGAALLIAGGVQIAGGKGRALLITGAALELAICAYWIISAALVDSGGYDIIDTGKGIVIGIAIFFAIMPTISLVMSVGASTTQFLQSRRGH
jgi:hypothetical protein